jgi:hypothetical protein
MMAIRKSRASSAPSPLDQISYLILKRCPALHAAFSMFQECHRKCCVSELWKQCMVSLIPKSNTNEDPSNPAKYHPTALTS